MDTRKKLDIVAACLSLSLCCCEAVGVGARCGSIGTVEIFY